MLVGHCPLYSTDSSKQAGRSHTPASPARRQRRQRPQRPLGRRCPLVRARCPSPGVSTVCPSIRCIPFPPLILLRTPAKNVIRTPDFIGLFFSFSLPPGPSPDPCPYTRRCYTILPTIRPCFGPTTASHISSHICSCSLVRATAASSTWCTRQRRRVDTRPTSNPASSESSRLATVNSRDDVNLNS